MEYSVPPTFRVTGPPKEGGEEVTGGGEILRNTGDTEREKVEFPECVEFGRQVQSVSGLEVQVGVQQDSGLTPGTLMVGDGFWAQKDRKG